jgi:hypothetical protein
MHVQACDLLRPVYGWFTEGLIVPITEHREPLRGATRGHYASRWPRRGAGAAAAPLAASAGWRRLCRSGVGRAGHWQVAHRPGPDGAPKPHTRLRSFCSPHHQDTALYPTITQLERAAGFRRDDTDEQRLDKLEAVLAQATNGLSEAVPLLAALLSLPTDGRYPPLNLTPQKRKERTLKAPLAQMEGLAARQSLLMVVEDAHWIDPTSLELLDLTVERVPSLPVLLIITFRPEFTPPESVVHR